MVHVQSFRLRQPADLIEPWIVPNVALNAMKAAMGAHGQWPTYGAGAGLPPPAKAPDLGLRAVHHEVLCSEVTASAIGGCLDREQLGVGAVLCHQVVVGAGLLDPGS